MIENMRKYTGLMVVVFVLLAAGFLFTMNDIGTGGNTGGGSTVLEVHGRAYDQSSYRQMGEQTLQLCSEVGMHNYINFLMAPDTPQLQQSLQLGRYGYNYFTMLRNNLNAQELNRFVANRAILQHSIREMGIYASEDDITLAIKSLPAFSRNGKYNPNAYSQFIDKRIGKLGMTDKHLRDIMSENICLNKLLKLVGGTLSIPRSAVQAQVEAQMQTITLAKVVFDRDEFLKKEDPSEEAIKSYWEIHQDAYKTDEQRRISYYFLDLAEEAQEVVEEAKATTDETAAKTPEEIAKKATDDKAQAEAKAAEAAKRKELRDAQAKKLARNINTFYDKILDSEDKKQSLDFATLVTEHGGQCVKSELFTRAALPKELQGLTLRGLSGRNQTLSDIIFKTKLSENHYNRVSDPLPVGENAWVIFVLEEVIEPAPLDYAAARNEVRTKLILENATKKMAEASANARASILELMKTGKDFDTAAREKNLTPIQVGPYSLSGTPPQDEPSAQQLHSKASELNPGEISQIINEANRSLFIYVEKRELEDTEQNKLRIDNAMNGVQTDAMIRTFLNWINHQYEKAEVKGATSES